MSVLSLQLLHGQSVLDILMLDLIFPSSQTLLQLANILLFARSALALILPHARKAVEVLYLVASDTCPLHSFCSSTGTHLLTVF